MQKLPPLLTIMKTVGETPLEAVARLRNKHLIPKDVPIAYAGRLDPMASGLLLMLIGEECKKQKHYHGFDKEYEFEVLLGIRSDTGDVLGVGSATGDCSKVFSEYDLRRVARESLGTISLPYPQFSSKTVNGKPLHTWTLEGRLHEITIPMRDSCIYQLSFKELTTISCKELFPALLQKIETVTTVTEESKALGRDFRREDIRARWNDLERTACSVYQIARFTAVVSTGTYIRSLSESIAKKLGTCGLAYAIHRSKIGTYQPLVFHSGFWRKTF